jgi:hypothetical protein
MVCSPPLCLHADKDAKEVTLFHIEGNIVAKVRVLATTALLFARSALLTVAPFALPFSSQVIEYMKYHKNVPPRPIEKPLQVRRAVILARVSEFHRACCRAVNVDEGACGQI